MNLERLLASFNHVRSLSAIRGSDEMAVIARALPGDPTAYVTVVKDLLDPLDGNYERLYEDPLFETFERLSDILRELYVLDFRTFEALILECEYALLDRCESGFGTNQTAAIACQIPPQGRGFANDEQFLRKVETFLASPAMRHNARGIAGRILRRSPQLARVPDSYPLT